MMTRRQRLAMLALAAIGLVVAFVALRPYEGEDEPAPTASTATPTLTPTDAAAATPEPTREPTPEPTPDPGPLLTAGEVRRIPVKKGERVRFRARSSEPEEIHVHGYDVLKELEPGKTVSVSFTATIEGIFEIELEHSATEIGQLRVEP